MSQGSEDVSWASGTARIRVDVDLSVGPKMIDALWRVRVNGDAKMREIFGS